MPIDLELSNSSPKNRPESEGWQLGGIGSGRHKQHHITDECVPIDTMHLLKRGLLTGEQLSTHAQLTYTCQLKNAKEQITEMHHSLSVLVERYAPGEPGQFSPWNAAGHITLYYAIKTGAEKMQKRPFAIPLVTTHPNYGGMRYWFLAPCCGRRCRVLYIPTFDNIAQTIPACRICLDLHYASQQQSYIERHKAYEKHLLSNYGYTWAKLKYHQLKEHYLKITPGWEYQGFAPLFLCACRQQERDLVDSGQIVVRSILLKGPCYDNNANDPCSAPCCQTTTPG